MAVGLSYGGVCRDCKGLHKCNNKPTAALPIKMECAECGGFGCKFCNYDGDISFGDCPLNVIDNDIYEVISYANLYKKGLPPVTGGSLDQAKSFIMAAEFIYKEQYYWKAKLGIIDDG